MAKTIVATPKAPGAIGPYSQGIKANGFVFASGQLEAAGSGLEKVVKVTVFLKDMKDFAAMNAVYSEFFKEDCPARSAVQVAALPKDGLVEIEVIAEA